MGSALGRRHVRDLQRPRARGADVARGRRPRVPDLLGLLQTSRAEDALEASAGVSATVYDPVFGCEIAHGRRDKDGYAIVGGRRAHIVAWELGNGGVEDGKELDHTCRNRACVALIHLEPVTRSENELRKSWRYRSKIERCPRGHLLAETAMVNGQGGRCCRTCRDEAAKERA